MACKMVFLREHFRSYSTSKNEGRSKWILSRSMLTSLHLE